MAASTIEYNTEETSRDAEKYTEEKAVGVAVDEVTGGVAIKREFTYKEQQKILRKIDMRLMPLLICAYALKNLDGNAVSYVKTLNTGTKYNIATQLNISNNDYAWLSTIFSIPFTLVELPSNMILKWSTPRLHFFRIVLLWSIAATLQGAANNFSALLAYRFFLGLFEGGLFPGILTLLTSYYRPDEVGPRSACVAVLFQVTNIFQSLITYGFTYFKNSDKISAWQVMFICEGGAGILLAIAIYYYMPNYPDTATWLTPAEREFVIARLPANAARSTDSDYSWVQVKKALTNPTTWLFWLLLLCYNSGVYGYQFWLPSIIAQLGFTNGASSTLLNIPPAAVYLFAGIGGAYITDHTPRIPRPVWLLFNAIFLIACFAGLAFAKGPTTLYALICVASIPAAWAINLMYPWRAQTLKGASYAAFAYGFMNGYGQIAGFYTAQIFRSSYAPTYTIPFVICMAMFALMAIITCMLWYLNFESERDTRMIAGKRRALGKKENRILEDDVVLK